MGKCYVQLRLNKVSELIHNSTNHRNLESGRVSVYFQEIIDTVRYALLWTGSVFTSVLKKACTS